jgi:DedD protein
MRSAFQNEELDKEDKQEPHADLQNEDDAPASYEAAPDRELTISATTLLAIFFGLVLLCGLFFGLGYTFGRRSPSNPAAANVQAASQSFDSQPKPSAAAQPVSAPVPTQPQPDASASAPADPAPDDTAPSPPEAKTPEAAPAKPTPQPTATPAPDPAPTGTMVQIAAIANPADADVLVRALQQHGFSASEHHYPTDALIHVQVGPFANRADAIAMKQKLLSDGYNAILK